LTAKGKTTLSVEGESIELDSEDIEVRLKANEGWAAAQGNQAVVVLSTELTPELIRSGFGREINRYVQDRRKELDLERTDRIKLWIATDSDEIKQAVEENVEYLKGETLATDVLLSECDQAGVEPCEVTVGEHSVRLWISVSN
jgi:isoleucyl-tRNA synthetase